ncbi:MAG: family 43 glycosylhydrolase [Lachnospiraceae bacterium]|nr:family 43 glycosylhydrolase [Lachnospiraceae bacterium]
MEKILSLALYPALYEPDMGVEFAQFPSKEYTDTYRTDVLFYGLSTDGKTFEPLNNNKAVMSPQGCEKLGSPSLFRKHEGGYGLIASADNASPQILLFDSDDLLYFTNQRLFTLNDAGITVKNPTVLYNKTEYEIYWEGGDGNSYVTKTRDFETFSNPSETDYKKELIGADVSLPDYAASGEASIFPLTKEEYDRIRKKYGRLKSISVETGDISIPAGKEAALPDKVNVVYSDGSKTPMGVTWDLDGLDLKNLTAGEYTVKGTVTATAEYHSPLANYRADPYAVYDEEKGVYYFTGSNMNENSANGGGAYQSIVIRQAASLSDITDAEEFEIWKDTTLDDGTRITGWYWAPEIHKIGGKWRILALASVRKPSDSEGSGKQCVFTCNGSDLTNPDNWEYTGYIHDTTDGQSVGSFDTTYFEYNGQSYYVTPKWSNIWITTVNPDNPLYPTGPLVRLSSADRAYETNNGSGKAGCNNMTGSKAGQAIQEASAVLIHKDRIFIAYAGCTIDMMYCVCLLYANLSSDLMNPDSWQKYPYPILGTQDLTRTIKKADYTATDGTTAVTGHGDSGLLKGSEGKYSGIFGPGHNSFTVDENGNPVIIYHARDWNDAYPGASGPDKYGLVDPGRHAYARPVIFNYEGFPVCNLTAEEYLAQDLKEIEIKIIVNGK